MILDCRRLFCLAALLVLGPFLLVARAEEALDLADILEKAVRHSHETRSAALDVEISKVARKEVRSLYFPTIQARWNSEYVKDLTGDNSQIAAVGNSVFIENTLFQNSLSLGTTYTLFDFGVKERKLFMADREIEVRNLFRLRSMRDTKIRVLNIYTDLLLTQKELEAKREILDLSRELSAVQERLYSAGVKGRTEVLDGVIRILDLVDSIERLQLKMRAAFIDLSLYTGETYGAEGLKVKDFEETHGESGDVFKAERLPESRIYVLEMEKKRAELEVLEQERYPVFGLYAHHIWYGRDVGAFDASVRDLKRRNFYVGLSAVLPLFDGFRNSVQRERVRLEIERLKIEMAQRVGELRGRFDKLRETGSYFAASGKNRKEMMTVVERKLSLTERLSDQKVVEWALLLTQRIEAVNKGFELAKSMVTGLAALKELRMLMEGDI